MRSSPPRADKRCLDPGAVQGGADGGTRRRAHAQGHADKLRFLHYVSKPATSWWEARSDLVAVLLEEPGMAGTLPRPLCPVARRVLEAVRERLPFEYRSPNAICAAEILLSFGLSAWAGARRFAHVKLPRGDVALRHLPGWRRLPGDDAPRAFFRLLRLEGGNAFFLTPTVWLLRRFPAREATLDLDPTVFERFGRLEGARKGYNPRRSGRLSHLGRWWTAVEGR